MLVQLKASDAFKEIIASVKKVKAIVLCEGGNDVKVFKIVAKRLGFTDRLRDVVVTDAEGLDVLRRDLFPSMLSLIVGRVISRPKPLALLIDANKSAPNERVSSIIDALKSREVYDVVSCTQICSCTWIMDIKTPAIGEIPVLIAVSGIFHSPFEELETHELEDHIAYLKLLTGNLGEGEVKRVKRASQLVTNNDFSLVESVDARTLTKAFEHMECLLEQLTTRLRKLEW